MGSDDKSLCQRLFEYLLENTLGSAALSKEIKETLGSEDILYWANKEENNFGVEFSYEKDRVRVQRTCDWNASKVFKTWTNGEHTQDALDVAAQGYFAVILDPRLLLVFLQLQKEENKGDSFFISGTITFFSFLKRFAGMSEEETGDVMENVPDSILTNLFITIEGLSDFSMFNVRMRNTETISDDEDIFRFTWNKGKE